MKTAEPNPEFKRLQALATQNFLNQNLEAAADHAREAVKTNPEIFAAHSLLSEILLAEGKDQDALTVLLAGAHTKRDPTLWWQLAERTLELAGEQRSPENVEQAIYCYTWAIKLDPNDYDSRREKLGLLLETGQTARARSECKMMVKTKPYDLAIIKQYADLCAHSNHATEIQRAMAAYDRAIEFYSKGKTLGLPDTQWSHLNVYMDLVEESGTPAEAVKRLKKLARWLLGRKEDEWWDDIEDDDREYDLEDVPRRILLQQFKESKFQGVDKQHMYGQGLPLELRVKMGINRAKVARIHLPEAMRQLGPLLSLVDEVEDYYDLFKEVGEALRTLTYHKEAIQFFEPIRTVNEACDHAYFMHLGESYLAVDRKAEAEECYKLIMDNDADDIESRIALAKFYESEQRMAEAIPIVHEVMRLGRSDAVRRARINVDRPQKQPRARGRAIDQSLQEDDVDLPDANDGDDDDDDEEEREKDENGQPILAKKTRKPRTQGGKRKTERTLKFNETLLSHREQDYRIKTNYLLLKSSKDAADEGDEVALADYMTAAHAMLTEFRGMKVFYPGRDKHIKFTGYRKSVKSALQNEMEAMKRRLQNDDADDDDPMSLVPDDSIPDDFHEIRFQEWLDIFCDYALKLARATERDRCYDTLQAAFFASVFYHNGDAKKQIHATWLACALLLNDEEYLCSTGRWYISEYSHTSSTYQLFAAIHRLFAGTPNWFNSGPTQKFILRSVKALDYALLDPAGRARYAFTGTERSSYTHGGKKDANPYNLSDLDPGVLALYGHIMAVAGSWASALNYYFRVFVLCPTDPTINLCIGLAFVHMGMKRQSENRHWQIYQGFAFVERYAEFRLSKGGGGLAEQEVVFNRGRVFHSLGLTHLAVPAYERCLDLAAQIAAEREDTMVVDQEDCEGGDGADGGNGDALLNVDQEEFTQEAALALVGIFSLADNYAAARAVTEKWLVL